MSRRSAQVLVAACVWTLYVWITRMWNIAHDDHSFGFKAVHAVLAVISVAFGIAVGVIGWRALRAQKSAVASAGRDDGRARTPVQERS
jgi:cytochrome bd-type quinol oxidase subunit 1